MFDRPSWEIRCRDAFAWLGEVSADSVDLVLSDPPYESMEKWRKVGSTTRLKHSKASSNDWFKVIPNELFPKLLRHFYRVLKPNRHCYIFCDQETMWHLRPAAEAAGFKWHKFLVWNKVAIGMGYHYRAQHELICFLEKGKRKVRDLSVPDVLAYKRVHGGYPTEKPVGLARQLITMSTEPGEAVLDPFMGSGAFGVAALEEERRFWGGDLCKEAVEVARERLQIAGGT